MISRVPVQLCSSGHKHLDAFWCLESEDEAKPRTAKHLLSSY